MFSRDFPPWNTSSYAWPAFDIRSTERDLADTRTESSRVTRHCHCPLHCTVRHLEGSEIKSWPAGAQDLGNVLVQELASDNSDRNVREYISLYWELGPPAPCFPTVLSWDHSRKTCVITTGAFLNLNRYNYLNWPHWEIWVMMYLSRVSHISHQFSN